MQHIQADPDWWPRLPVQVVMKDGQTVAEGQKIAEDLMAKLGISEDSLVTGAYMDLLLQKWTSWSAPTVLQELYIIQQRLLAPYCG